MLSNMKWYEANVMHLFVYSWSESGNKVLALLNVGNICFLHHLLHKRIGNFGRYYLQIVWQKGKLQHLAFGFVAWQYFDIEGTKKGLLTAEEKMFACMFSSDYASV